MMFLRTVESAFARYQAKGEAAALAIVFDRTAPELLRLARHLVGGGDLAVAEDLVQATFLTAIESAQAHERGRPVLPWLCGILANHARSHRRQARRAPDPERIRLDDVRDVYSETAGKELEQEVRDAIARLPEVYRPVLRLWLEHGFEAHEIAATLERPAGTVRAQVTRGIDQLRRALPAGLAGGAAVALSASASASVRGLAAVRTDVLAACSGTSSGLVSTLIFGGWMMLHHKLAVAATAALLGLLAWFAWPPAPEPDAPTPLPGWQAASLANGTAPADQSPATATGEESGVRSLAATTNAKAPPPAAAASSDAPASTTLEIEVRDAADNRALVGYGVSISRADALQEFGDLANFESTDSRGTARFAGLQPGQWLVAVDRVGFAVLAHAEARQTVRKVVLLQPQGTIRGQVLTPSGQPASNASIHTLDNGIRPPKLVQTDRNGRFEIRHASQLTLQARHSQHAPSLSHPVSVARGSSVDVTLQLLEGGRAITGVVLDQRSNPLANVAVAILPGSARTVHPLERDQPTPHAHWLRTDGEGRFRTTEVGAGEYLVLAVPRMRWMTPAAATVDTSQQDAFAELQVPKPTTIEGRVLKNGKPAAGVQVTAFPEQPDVALGYLLNLVGLRTATVADDGTFRIVGVLPGTLQVRAMNGMSVVAQAQLELLPGETHSWYPELGGKHELRLYAIAAGNVKLPTPLFVLAYPSSPGGAGAAGSAGTPVMQTFDGNGKTAIEVSAGQPVDLVLATQRGRNFVGLARIEGVVPGPDEQRIELRRDQLPEYRIRGRLVDSVQAPLAGKNLSVRRVDAPGLMVHVEATTDPDGKFAIGPLPAGTYTLLSGSLAKAVPLRQVTVTANGDEQVGNVQIARAR